MLALVALIDAALPQTQCMRCTYSDCAGYAQALASGNAAIDQCPPGGTKGIAKLAALTGQPVRPLNPQYGYEGPQTLAVIDEEGCIGCTLCIKVCPTDAIVGSNKFMHTVMDGYCTGCALCVPVCPVDCIAMVNASTVNPNTVAADWSPTQAMQAKTRYELRKQRLLAPPPKPTAATGKAIMAAALARSRSQPRKS